MLIKAGRVISVEEILKQEKEQESKEKLENSSGPIKIEEILEKNSKWYMPRLYLNDPTMWESKPNEERRMFTDKVATETCLGKCCGVEGLKSACCTMDPNELEHVIGPVKEDEIERIERHFRIKGWNISRNDFILDFEEGQMVGETFFNGHEIFKSKASYPMLRPKVAGIRFTCFFLHPESGKCSIHQIKFDFCKTYLCQYVRTNFLVNTPIHKNMWNKIR